MSPARENPWMLTGTGRIYDLLCPRADIIDFERDVPEGLARTARFAGQVPAGPYSVAQHLVLGTDAILATGKPDAWAVAQAFLLHDAHEHILGDETTPFQDALAWLAGDLATTEDIEPEIAERLVHGAFSELKRRSDLAIHAAAGLAFPLPREIRDQVKAWDLGMLATERLHLLPRTSKRWADAVEDAQPVRLRGRIRVWPWPEAADEWRLRFRTLFPHAAARASA